MKADNLWKTLYIVNIFEKLSLKRIYIYIYILKFLKRVYLDVYQRKMRTRNTLRFHDGGNNLQPIGIG